MMVILQFCALIRRPFMKHTAAAVVAPAVVRRQEPVDRAVAAVVLLNIRQRLMVVQQKIQHKVTQVVMALVTVLLLAVAVLAARVLRLQLMPVALAVPDVKMTLRVRIYFMLAAAAAREAVVRRVQVPEDRGLAVRVA